MLLRPVWLVQPASRLVFPSQRHGNKAVQAIQVEARPQGPGLQPQAFTFTFCLERIDVGPYKVPLCSHHAAQLPSDAALLARRMRCM